MVGYIMLVMLFVGIFIIYAQLIGIKDTLVVFGLGTVLVAWIIVAVSLT